MTHDHVVKWACPRSAGARLSTRETGNEASYYRGTVHVKFSCSTSSVFVSAIFSTWYAVYLEKKTKVVINIM